jgi:ATP adenylyltransferase
MKSLYAPWREEYSQSHDPSKRENSPAQKCVFCSIIKATNDDENFILKRTMSSLIILNKYPYNAGHILVIPYSHARELTSLDACQRAELMELMNESLIHINNALQPEGINIGLNLGSAAGAGIPSHLHFHVLPRWNGDTNFLPTLATTKVVSFNLQEIFEKLKPLF